MINRTPYPGGRGKKAPYQTEMYRIPSALKPLILSLGVQFKLLYDGSDDPRAQKFISRIESAIVGSEDELEELRSQVEALKDENALLKEELASSQQRMNPQAVAILKAALGLKANAGGAIKAKIKEAFPELSDE